MDSPGFKRLTKDRAKYEALIEDTKRRQREALDEARKNGPPPEPRVRGRGRKDTEYPSSEKGRKR